MKDENLNLEFKGVWIPATIWLNKELSIQEKMLLVKIDSFKTCFASNQYLADFMGLSVPRVKSIIGNLRKLGFITSKEDRKGNITTKRTLYVDQVMFHGIAGIENNTTPVLDPIPPRIENDTHSNTASNKESNTVKKTCATESHSSDDLLISFDMFWQAGMKKVNKKKALSAYKTQFKANKKNLGDSNQEINFANHLANDIQKRLDLGQLGFSEMHPTTYLNGERWNDDYPAPRQQLSDFGQSSVENWAEGLDKEFYGDNQ